MRDEYVKELEDLIMDKLLPGYIENCRTKGIDPKIQEISSHLLKVKKLYKPLPALLRKPCTP